MSDDIYDPLGKYQEEYAEKFSQVVDDTFKELEVKSGVNREENIKLCDSILDLEKNKGKVDGKLGILQILFWICILGMIGLIGHGIWSLTKDVAPLVPILEIVGGGILGVIAFIVLRPPILKLDEESKNLGNKIDELKDNAWAQMAPLNDLFDWDISTRMFHQTVPMIEFDRFFHTGRLLELINDYNLGEYGDFTSIVATQSGAINDNPFVIAQLFCQDWERKTYHGSLDIKWKERVLNSEGEYVWETKFQTLRASYEADVPVYFNRSVLCFGSEVAPDLSFTRKQSQFSGSKSGRSGAIKELVKHSQNLKKNNNYTLMPNHDFELLFKTLDRTNEQQYRMLFTPLAQTQMMKLLEDKKVGYGDDFVFEKNQKINMIYPDHLVNQDIRTAPQRYFNFDIRKSEEIFKAYNKDFFKSVYFAFAPLLTIPIYQQMRPLRKIYGESETQASLWDIESIANYMGAEMFGTFDTPTILKAKSVMRHDKRGLAAIEAHGYSAVKRTAYVSVRGGDGNDHDVPVEWIEYVSSALLSYLVVEEDNPNDSPRDIQTIANDMAEGFGAKQCSDIFMHRNVWATKVMFEQQ